VLKQPPDPSYLQTIRTCRSSSAGCGGRRALATAAVRPIQPGRLALLRERRGEILPLARHFIDRYAAAPVRIGTEAAALLAAHAWPGNIRELENVIQFALIVCRGGEIRPGDLRLIQLDLEPTEEDAAPAPVADAAPAEAALVTDLAQAVHALPDARTPLALHRIEALAVRAAFEKCRGNQVHAAQLLGITRNSMRTLLRRHDLGAATPAKR
jgi:sigma-54-specific transcriptional regulator